MLVTAGGEGTRVKIAVNVAVICSSRVVDIT